MKLSKLQIQNFRNITNITFECDDKINYFFGANGQGKTAILEAINLISSLNSFREKDLSMCIQEGSTHARVKGAFVTDGFFSTLEVSLEKTTSRLEKKAYVNEKFTRSAKDYFLSKLKHPSIEFHAISLNPASTELIHGEPALRRRYLNQIMSYEQPGFIDVLQKYQRTLDQKNAYLKSEERDEALLNALNQTLAQAGAEIRYQRICYLNSLAPKILDFLSKIAPDQRPIELVLKMPYLLHFTGQFNLPTVQILKEQFHAQLNENARLEGLRKVSVVGPHRDDWTLNLLAEKGSQGEVRSALLAIKLSEIAHFAETTRIQPVFLIDDFSSELDSRRRSFLLRYLNESGLQVFVTSTDELEADLEVPSRRFYVKQGTAENRTGKLGR